MAGPDYRLAWGSCGRRGWICVADPCRGGAPQAVILNVYAHTPDSTVNIGLHMPACRLANIPPAHIIAWNQGHAIIILS